MVICLSLAAMTFGISIVTGNSRRTLIVKREIMRLVKDNIVLGNNGTILHLLSALQTRWSISFEALIMSYSYCTITINNIIFIGSYSSMIEPYTFHRPFCSKHHHWRYIFC